MRRLSVSNTFFMALLALTSLSVVSPVNAQALRALLLSKYTLDGQSMDASGLDATASQALRNVGLRVVDLENALRAQRMALSDEVQAGRVPNELSVLNVDVLLSLQLRCSESGPAILGSKLYALQCVLDGRVVSTSSGDVLFAQSQSLTGHGLSAQMAVQSLLDKRVPHWLARASDSWLAAWNGVDSWETDVSVSHISDRETGQGIAKQLGRLPGVTAARLLAFDRGLAKYAVSGRGRELLEGLADAIDNDPILSLSVTYETAHQLAAEFDFARAYRQRIMAMTVIPRSSELYTAAPELMRSALMNLPYLDMAHTLPLLASPEEARDMEARLRDRAKILHVPLVLAAQLVPNATGWIATIKLVDTRLGRTLTAASAAETSSTRALGAAAHSFDERFRVAIQRASVRERFGFDDLAARLSAEPRLVIESFQLPSHAGAAASQPAAISLRNPSQAVARAPRLRITALERELSALALPDVAPGATLQVPVTFDPASLQGDDCSLVTASVSYETHAGYEHVERVVAWPSSAPRARPAVAQGAPREYADNFAAAVRKHEAGDWEAALALYRRSHELYSNAQTLRGLGMVELDLGQIEAARRDLRASLRSPVLALSEQERGHVRQWMTRSRPLR